MKDLNMACGIDTCYYFAESNENYDNFFLDLLDQIEDKKSLFERREIEYNNNDIVIELNSMSLQYLNKAEGFYWFRDIDERFKIGFKDENKNKKLHNIRVQLQGIGIYSLGIKPLLSLINDDLLKDITSGLFLMTRVDINCFVNYDFSFVDKSMFATKKTKYYTIAEHGSATKTQTIYVGQNPFMLRLYNKTLELSKSKKQELMYEYFQTNGLNTEELIFNVEFQMHRDHLRAYEVNTLEDLLCNANTLFKKAMADIRLLDITTLSDKAIKNNTKNRTKSHEVWSYIKENFDIKEFLQLDTPLQRVKRKSYIYDLDKFIQETQTLLKKGIAHHIGIVPQLLSNITFEFLKELEKQEKKRQEANAKKINYIPVTIEGDSKDYRLLPNGELIEPIKCVSFKELGDYELDKEIYRLEAQLAFDKDIDKKFVQKKLEIALDEQKSRRK